MAAEPPKQPRRPAEEEAALISNLRQKILDNYASKNVDKAEVERMGDKDFLRFIRARKYDLEPAYNMLMTALEWRTKEKPHCTWSRVFGSARPPVPAAFHARLKISRPTTKFL